MSVSLRMRSAIRLCVTKPIATYAAATFDFTRPLCLQACENVLQGDVRIMPIEPRRLDQTHERRRPFTAA